MARRRAENRRIVADYLSGKGCADCGESDPVVLDFDHRNPADKLDGVARLISSGAPPQRLHDEIEKCDVRCSNCHRRRTARQREDGTL